MGELVLSAEIYNIFIAQYPLTFVHDKNILILYFLTPSKATRELWNIASKPVI